MPCAVLRLSVNFVYFSLVASLLLTYKTQYEAYIDPYFGLDTTVYSGSFDYGR